MKGIYLPKSLSKFISETDIRILTTVPVLIWFLCLFGVTLIAPKYEGYLSQNLLISLAFLFGALAPLAVVIKKEMYLARIHLRGTPAVIVGVVWLILAIFLASIPLIGLIVKRWLK